MINCEDLLSVNYLNQHSIKYIIDKQTDLPLPIGIINFKKYNNCKYENSFRKIEIDFSNIIKNNIIPNTLDEIIKMIYKTIKIQFNKYIIKKDFSKEKIETINLLEND